MDTSNSESFSNKSLIFTPKPTRVRRCDTTSTWSTTKISTGCRRENNFPKCPFVLAKGKSSHFDQHLSLEELDKDFTESKAKSDVYLTQKEILSILSDSNSQEFEYEMIERVKNPFYKNLDLDD